MQNTSQEVLLARGVYATVRAEWKDLILEFTKTCGNMTSQTAFVLRTIQDGTFDDDELVRMAEMLGTLSTLSAKIRKLAKEADEIKVTAWP